jgi:hypothetical protein
MQGEDRGCFVSGAVLLRLELDPDYAAGKKAIEAKQCSVAVTALSLAALRGTRNADIQNYLGYTYATQASSMPLSSIMSAPSRLVHVTAVRMNKSTSAYMMVNTSRKHEEYLEGATTDLLDSLRVRGFEDEDRTYKRSSKH